MGIKENYVFDKHPYRISKQKSGRWKTYIKDDLKGRKAIERNEKKDLIDFLYNYYYAEEKTAQSMATVFEAFLAYKLDCENRSPETCERLRYTYKKFIKDTLGKRKMSGITKNELTAYVQSIIIEKRPRERELKSFLQMLHGLFRFAYMNRYIHEDVSALIRADNYYKDCDCSKKDASQKIFTRNEILRIKKELESRVPNPRAYAVLLAIETGMRSGELCALQWSDIGPRDIHIHRQQLLRTNHGKREGFYEVPYTKDERRHPHGGRYFPLTENCRWILSMVRANSEEGSKYVFTENGTWISKTSYELFLKRICQGIGLTITNNHAFRMSLNSNVLIPAGLDARERAAILGHSITTNESYYTYTRRDEIVDIGDRLNNF